MSELLPHTIVSRARAARLAIVASLALASGLSLSAGSAPIRLLGVSARQRRAHRVHGACRLRREASRSVDGARRAPQCVGCHAANVVGRRDPIAEVTLEQGPAIDGQALAWFASRLHGPPNTSCTARAT